MQPTAYFDPNVGLTVVSGTDSNSWSLFYSADQSLWVDSSNSRRDYGIFTNVGTADNGPSPIRFTANVALYGSSPSVSRPLDTFGVGYAFTQYSSPVQNLAPSLRSIGDDQAIEFFYNAAVTPWCHITPNLQVISPARENTLPPAAEAIHTSLVLGLRAKIEF